MRECANHRVKDFFNNTHLHTLLLRFVWLASFLSLAGMIVCLRGRGWDVVYYYRAMQLLSAGMDPYADGIARQYAALAAGRHTFTYVYPPLTLLVLRGFNLLPVWLASALYWMIYAAGFAALLWAGAQCFHPQERERIGFLIPLVIFFPGLMTGDDLLSGNVAYILYGLIFSATVPGWRRNQWSWFYAAVFFAACFKPPLLTLLAIPLLAGIGQWFRSATVAAASLCLLALQRWLWPTEFREFLLCVHLQFKLNSDFGLSPAGVLGRFLYMRGLPYSTPTTLVFLIYGLLLFTILFCFNRLYRQRRIAAESWIPVLLVGTILLNPRIMQYDVHAVTLPMMLIVARSLLSRSKAGIALTALVLVLIGMDMIGISLHGWDDLRNMIVLVAVAALGLRSLIVEARNSVGALNTPKA
jgi:hypothetical protein